MIPSSSSSGGDGGGGGGGGGEGKGFSSVGGSGVSRGGGGRRRIRKKKHAASHPTHPRKSKSVRRTWRSPVQNPNVLLLLLLLPPFPIPPREFLESARKERERERGLGSGSNSSSSSSSSSVARFDSFTRGGDFSSALSLSSCSLRDPGILRLPPPPPLTFLPSLLTSLRPVSLSRKGHF